MLLRNKKTGEIVDLSEGVITDTYGGEKIQIKPVAISNKEGYVYSSLAELNAEWEDAPEEPKKYWYMNDGGRIKTMNDANDEEDVARKEIGNHFSSREEAELAVRKLKAWKRLKDKGFRFCCDIKYESLCGNGFNIPLNAIMPPEAYTDTEVSKDLDTCFGGGE